MCHISLDSSSFKGTVGPNQLAVLWLSEVVFYGRESSQCQLSNQTVRKLCQKPSECCIFCTPLYNYTVLNRHSCTLFETSFSTFRPYLLLVRKLYVMDLDHVQLISFKLSPRMTLDDVIIHKLLVFCHILILWNLL